MNIQYIGEELLWGKIGNLLVVLAFTAALLAVVAYCYALRNNDAGWKKFARQAFLVHSISVVGIFALLFFLIFRHRFEYYYVWEHSNMAMPLRYIFSCFWEGQEGSFLLWLFWHCVLSGIIIFTAGEWENGVMAIVCMVQVFLASMLLGVVVLNYKIGSNPFVLLRDHPDFSGLPFIKLPDYLSKIHDGRGLNPLLQNYWMTIHPPTLFLGFASTVIPFAFGIAGLLRKKYTEWIKPALPWTFFGVMILGTGILMGAAWAYESLSFGGFWAWDPVENASLVPWMTLVGAAHLMLIYRHRQRALLSTFILTILTFLLILYSTFLTRSGILGDSSVHAFTDLGMSGQLVFYLGFFLILSVSLLLINRKHLISKQEEEHVSSREFWMFIGMLVLVIGSLQITFTTSTPVINKLFPTSIAPPADPIGHYNRWQVPIAVLVCLLIGVSQYFKWQSTDWKMFRTKLRNPLFAAVLVTLIAAIFLRAYPIQYYALLFASAFAFLANINYLVTALNGKFEKSGPSIAHAGIGLLLCGALISNSKKEIISQNFKNLNLGKDLPNNENILIEARTDTLPMGQYYVSYSGKEKKGVNIYYTISYFKANSQTGEKEKAFDLKPLVQLNERMGNVAEPATAHFLTKDIYTHITYAELDKSNSPATEDFQPAKNAQLAIGDTFVTSNCFIVFEGFNKDIDRSEFHLKDSDIAVGARLKIEDVNRKIYKTEPVFMIRNLEIYSRDEFVDELGLKIQFTKIDPSTGKIELSVSEKNSNKKDFVIMKAIIFPGINLLWSGCILMIIGTFISIRRRIRQNKTQTAKT